MSDTQRHDTAISTAIADRHLPLRGLAALALSIASVVTGALVSEGSALAAPLDDSAIGGVVRFQPTAAFPPMLAGRLEGAVSIHVAVAPQGTLYAATDKSGKARLWLVRNNALVGDVTAPASREHMVADWPGSFAFWLGTLPVVAVSWRFGGDAYGIEDYAFWASEGNGRFLGGLPGSTRSACSAGAQSPDKSCARCSAAAGIPIDLRLLALEPDRARFVQRRASTWYYYYSTAAETFEQDYVLTASGLVPEGPARGRRTLMALPQAQERVKGLLHDYFQLAKSRSRESIAPEFLTCFEQLVDLAPDFAKGYYNVGCMNALLGNRKEAVTAVVKALSIEPNYKKLARRDPDLASVRDDPEIVRALGGSP